MCLRRLFKRKQEKVHSGASYTVLSKNASENVNEELYRHANKIDLVRHPQEENSQLSFLKTKDDKEIENTNSFSEPINAQLLFDEIHSINDELINMNENEQIIRHLEELEETFYLQEEQEYVFHDFTQEENDK